MPVVFIINNVTNNISFLQLQLRRLLDKGGPLFSPSFRGSRLAFCSGVALTKGPSRLNKGGGVTSQPQEVVSTRKVARD